jgi:hypothetical protein
MRVLLQSSGKKYAMRYFADVLPKRAQKPFLNWCLR